MFTRLLAKLEQTPMTVSGWFAGFAGVVFIRFFLESLSSGSPSGYLSSDLPTLIHYGLFYLAAVLAVVVVARAIAPQLPRTLLRTMVFFVPIMWLAPLIDLARGGAPMAYLLVPPHALLHDFLTYFGPLTTPGVTLGIRIELALLLCGIGAYVYAHTREAVRTVLVVVASYAVLFVLLAFPSFVAALSFPGSPVTLSLWYLERGSLIGHSFLHPAATYDMQRLFEMLFDALMAQVWYVVAVGLGILWLAQNMRALLASVVSNIRPERLAHFLLFTGIGGAIALGREGTFSGTLADWFTVATTILVVTGAWVFAVAVNDLVDEDIDAISNADRPLVTGALSHDAMREVAVVAGLMTFLGALALGSYAFFSVVVFTAAYYVYSAPPLRLKRVPMLASALIGLATVACFELGFYLVSADRMLSAFPGRLVLVLFLSVSLIVNVRDLKDIEGDRAAGVHTLATLIGTRAGMGLGALVCLAFCIVPLGFMAAPAGLWALSFIAGGLSWALLARGGTEKAVFGVYFAYLLLAAFLLA